jgi:tetratricopeptide (TPR) repeat protein
MRRDDGMVKFGLTCQYRQRSCTISTAASEMLAPRFEQRRGRMKSTPSQIVKAAAVCVFSAMLVLASTSREVAAQYAPQTKAPQSNDKSKQTAMSEGEEKAVLKIKAAPDVPAKILAAGEFVKKYPKSMARSNIVMYIAGEVEKLPDETQRITQLENLLTVFKEPADVNVIDPILVNRYFLANRPDDGFRVVSAYLATNPNDVGVLTQGAIEGGEQAKKSNPKFVQQSQQYGNKAIELIEAGKKPEAFDDARWNEYRTKWLPILYQSLGMLSLVSGDKTDARAKLDKSLSLNPADTFTYVLIGSLFNDEYQQLVAQYKSLTAGPLKDSVLKQAYEKMDQVIDMYAHAIALSEGKPEYQRLHDRLREDLENYYKSRHGGATDGLQQLIDKYKKL